MIVPSGRWAFLFFAFGAVVDSRAISRTGFPLWRSGRTHNIDISQIQAWKESVQPSSTSTGPSSHTTAEVTQSDVSRTMQRQQDTPATSKDSHQSVARQAASNNIAHQGGAVTASLATILSGVPAEPQPDPTFGILRSAPAPGLHSEGSTDIHSDHVRALSTQPTNTGRGPLTVTDAATIPSASFDSLLEVIDQVVSSAGRSAALLKVSTAPMSDSQSTDSPQNALSVFLSALPSDVASSIEAGVSVVTQQLLATSEAETSRPTTRPSPSDEVTTSISRPSSRPAPSRSDDRPSSKYTAKPPPSQTKSHPTSRPTSKPTSHHPTTQPSSPPPTRSSTLTTLPSTTSTPSPTSSTTTSSTTSPAASTPTITPEQQQSNGTIAGIATGSAAGVVLIIMAIFFFLRRRNRKRALQTIEAKASQPYPEVAWLYDPVRSPPRVQSPAPGAAPGAGSGGVAGGQARDLGMTQAQAQRSSLLAPEVVVLPEAEGEPLLAPSRAATRESSPAGGRSGSPGGRVR